MEHLIDKLTSAHRMMKDRRHNTAGLGAPIMIIDEVIKELQKLEQCSVSGSLPPDYDLERLYEWIMDENRKSAKTAFTSGPLRKVADEIEFRLWRQLR